MDILFVVNGVNSKYNIPCNRYSFMAHGWIVNYYYVRLVMVYNVSFCAFPGLCANSYKIRFVVVCKV